MPGCWSQQELARIGRAEELQIATTRADGSLRRWTPIWVVCAGDRVYVRTWHRRHTGWFGHALDSGRARIRVPRLEADVEVEDVGAEQPELRAGVDAAYRAKYQRHGDPTVSGMVTDDAAASTLRLVPTAGAGEDE